MEDLATDTFYEFSNIPTEGCVSKLTDYNRSLATNNYFYQQAKLPPTSFQFTGNCGAVQVYSIEEFNQTERLGESYCQMSNPGMVFYLNPNKEEVKEIPGTKVDYVQLGVNVMAIRLSVDGKKLGWAK